MICNQCRKILSACTCHYMDEYQPVKPAHYHNGGIDVFTFAEANLSKEKLIGYHQTTAIKYIIRAGKKDSALQDFQKAETHVRELIRLEEST